MTDPRTPDESGRPATPPPAQPTDEGPDAPQLDSFAAESPAEPSDAVTPPDAASTSVDGGTEEAPAAATLADEEPVSPEPVTPEPVTPEPVTPEPVPMEPVPAEPVTPEPVAPEPVTPPPSVEPPVVEPPTVQPPTTEPPVVEPPTVQPPTAEAPAAPTEPPAGTPTADDPAALAAAAPLAAAAAAPSGDTSTTPPTDTSSEDASPADAATAQRSRSRAWLPLAAIGTAVGLLTAGTGFLAWQVRQEARAEEAREDAKAAARDAARVLFSYNHETLAQDFERGLSVTTGDFRDQYSRTTKEVVTPVAEQYDAVVEAEVIEAAIVDGDADEVTAIVFLNQATTSTRVQGQQVDQSRVRMRLVLRDGRWLVEEVGAL